MYGKNLMGSYKDKISYEERWQVIHYIRSLQAKSQKLDYSQMVNTLNDIDRPAGEMIQVVEVHEDHTGGEHDSDNHDSEGDHGHEHSDGDHSTDGH